MPSPRNTQPFRRPRCSRSLLSILRIALAVAFLFGCLAPVAAQTEPSDKAQPETDPIQSEVTQPNPLERVIQRVFGRRPNDAKNPPAEPNSPPQANADSAPGTEPALVRRRTAVVDPTALNNETALALLTRSQRFASDGNWDEALRTAQRLLETPDTGIVVETDRVLSVVEICHRLLEKAPRESVRRIEAQFGPVATKAWQNARTSGDLAAMASVAVAYPYSSAGREAANFLASSALDHGDPVMAVQWCRLLWRFQAPLIHTPAWRSKAFLACLLAESAFAAKPNANSDELHPGELANELSGVLTEADRTRVLRLRDGYNAAYRRSPSPQTDWPVLMGRSDRNALTRDGAPLLSLRGGDGVDSSDRSRALVRGLMETLAEQRIAPFTVLSPIAVNGRIICRTLNGVAVVDAESGKKLWTTELGAEAESDDEDLDAEGSPARWIQLLRRALANPQNEPDLESAPSLLLRNWNFGQVSSDGSRVFVWDDPMSRGSPRYNDSDMPDQSGATLAAFDLETGHLEWRIDSTTNGDGFDSPLAGIFFYGPPVPFGDELYVIGERYPDVRLYVLNASTGDLRWSRLIGGATTNIWLDTVRRWRLVQPSVTDNLVLCPTGNGWLVAVDRRTQRIRWVKGESASEKSADAAHDPNGESSRFAQLEQLQNAWLPSPPVLADGRVLVTTSEPSLLYCLDAASSRVYWKLPRENWRYIAGVQNGRVVLVGDTAIAGYKLDSGEVAWQTNLDPVSGRGVMTSGGYFVPLVSGGVVRIDVQTGDVTLRRVRSDGPLPLGNLVFHRNTVASVGLNGLELFSLYPQQSPPTIPADPSASPTQTLLAAETLVSSGDGKQASLLLRSLSAPADQPELAMRLKKLLRRAVLLQAETPPLDAEVINELRSLSESPGERLECEQLALKEMRISGRTTEAFVATVSLLRESWPDLFALEGPDRVSVTGDWWLAGEAAELWIGGDVDPAVGTAAVQNSLESVRNNSPETRLRLARCLSFHELAQRELLEISNSLLRDGNRGLAVLVLERLRSSPRTEIRAAAATVLHSAYGKAGWPSELVAVERELSTFATSGAVLVDGKTVQAWIAGEQAAGRWGALGAAAAPAAAPKLGPMSLQSMGATYTPHFVQTLSFQLADASFLRDHRVESPINDHRLIVRRLNDDDAVVMTIPLHAAPNAIDGSRVVAFPLPAHLAVLHRDLVQMVSLFDQRVVWSVPTGGIDGRTHFASYEQAQVPQFRSPQAAADITLQPEIGQHRVDGIVAANAEVVVVRRRRSLAMHDALTGELRWRLDALRPECAVAATASAVYYRPEERTEFLRLNSLDGRRKSDLASGRVSVQSRDVESQDVSTKPAAGTKPGPEVARGPAAVLNPAWSMDWSRALAVIDDDVVLFANGTDPKTSHRRLEIARMRFTGDDVWRHVFPAASQLCRPDDDTLLVLHQNEKNPVIAAIRLRTGELQDWGVAPPAFRPKKGSEIHVFSDADRYYFLTASGRPNASFLDQVSFIPAQGTLAAFDRRSKAWAWTRSVKNQYLIVDQMWNMPVLLFLARRFESKGLVQSWLADVLVIDKQTGDTLFEHSLASQPGLIGVRFSPQDRYVELNGYNERLRLTPAPNSTGSEKK